MATFPNAMMLARARRMRGAERCGTPTTLLRQRRRVGSRVASGDAHMNPTVSQAVIDRAMDRDAASASR